MVVVEEEEGDKMVPTSYAIVPPITTAQESRPFHHGCGRRSDGAAAFSIADGRRKRRAFALAESVRLRASVGRWRRVRVGHDAR